MIKKDERRKKSAERVSALLIFVVLR